MEREAIINTAILTAAIAILLIAFWLTPAFLFLYGIMLVAALVYAALFVPKFRAGFVRAPPDRALASLAHRLRAARLVVTESQDSLVVTRGPVTGVRIFARPLREGSEIAYRVETTTRWLWVVWMLVFLVWTSAVGIPVIVYVFFRVRRWVREVVAPVLREPFPEPPPVDDVRATLVAALSEGYRFASEGAEAVRDSYHNTLGVVVLGAIMAWFFLFLGFGFVLPLMDFSARILLMVGLSTLGTVAAAVPVALIVRRRHSPRITESRWWVDRLRAAYLRETERAPSEDLADSAFELLAAASVRVPGWQAEIRRAGMARDPFAWFAVFWMVWLGAELLIVFSVAFASIDLIFGLLTGLAGAGLLAAAIVSYRRWKRRLQDQQARELGAWNSRLSALHARMEQFFQDM